jgi:hypothetical protein
VCAEGFKYIILAARLIAAPPIALWPQVVAHVPAPEDVE